MIPLTGLTFSRGVRSGGLIIALAALTSSCNDGGASPISPTPVAGLTIEAVTSAISVNGIAAALRDGAAPPVENGPDIEVLGNNAIINGGTLSVGIVADAPFTTLHMFVAVPSEGIAGSEPGIVDGYYEVQLPSPQTSATALLSFPQEIPLELIDLRFAASAGSEVGEYQNLQVEVIQVGTGDVQVTLSWDAESDIDLHVVAPNGQEIYFANPNAAGGTLDLDSNAACNIDGVRNENITWPTGTAPTGRYIVRVDNWDSCGVARTNFTVRVNNGGNAQVFTGFFDDTGDRGGLGSGVLVTTFTRSSGPTVTTSATPAAAAQSLKSALSLK